jgi:hypothetical protein
MVLPFKRVLCSRGLIGEMGGELMAGFGIVIIGDDYGGLY